ncbi:MAG: flavin-containing monooxygenase [Parvibaculales bacterium]
MQPQFDIIIIGTGFGGLCMAHKLKQAGYDNILLLEKGDEVGGTWRENTYPGAECDIPSVLYSYSFAPNPAWDFKWAKQPQIFRYLKDFASDRDLRRHIRFGVTVLGASFDEPSGVWTVKTDAPQNTDISCRYLVSAVGQLHHPNLPDIDGRASFAGPNFHSAQWDHDIELDGKRVGVIGSAASAIQLIPEVAQSAKELTIYQRSPNWVIDKGDRPYTALEKKVAAVFPAIQKLYRFGVWCLGEYGIYPVIRGAPIRSFLARAKNRRDMRKFITDPQMRQALTPDYQIGAKRILFSDKYYKTLAQDHVELVTSGIKTITADGVTGLDAVHRQHDVLVFATGFHTNPFLKEIDVRGRGGHSLKTHWVDGAFAYHGIVTSGFPNLFLLYGPNTNTGHTSVVATLEQESDYIIQLLRRAGGRTIEVEASAEADFGAEMQRRLQGLAWSNVEASWYKVGTKVTNNWPGSALEFKRRLRSPVWRDFSMQPPTKGRG